MAKKITGTVVQFGSKGYGFIESDDKEKYFVHQNNIYNNSRLKVGTRVVFNVENSDKGVAAIRVKLQKGEKYGAKSLSDGAIKTMFAILFIVQIVVLYQVFLA